MSYLLILLTNWEDYVNIMRPRILWARETLRDDGSLFCHCTWNTDSFFQSILDEYFGRQNFAAKIIWQYRSSSIRIGKYIPHTYDVILVYTKSKATAFTPLYSPFSNDEASALYKYTESNSGRRYRLISLISPRSTSGYNYEFLNVTRPWRLSKERMEEEYKLGRIVQTKPGAVPMQKQYMGEGKLIGDIWTDISIKQFTKGRVGYPTEKPVELLDRIIQMSTIEGDLVLDPFCGSGTTLLSAGKLGRKWIGIDISSTACQIAAERLFKNNLMEEAEVILQSKNSRSQDEITNMPYFEFENWIISLLKDKLASDGDFKQDIGLGATNIVETYSITRQSKFDLVLGSQSMAIPVMVKQKDSIDAKEIEYYAFQLSYHNHQKGIYVALSFSESALNEIENKRQGGIEIIPIRVNELV